MSTARKYGARDIDMLTAAQTVVANFKANIEDLTLLRKNWPLEYPDEMQDRISKSLQKIGIDPKEVLHNTSDKVFALQNTAIDKVKFLKTQIKADFKNDPDARDRILSKLGFIGDANKPKLKSQEGLIEFLYSFTNNLTPELREEITAYGLNPALLDTIAGYAETLNQANTKQESLKVTTSVDTSDMVDELNAIYDEVMSICAIARRYYHSDPLKKAQFTFSKILANQGPVSTGRKATASETTGL